MKTAIPVAGWNTSWNVDWIRISEKKAPTTTGLAGADAAIRIIVLPEVGSGIGDEKIGSGPAPFTLLRIADGSSSAIAPCAASIFPVALKNASPPSKPENGK